MQPYAPPAAPAFGAHPGSTATGFQAAALLTLVVAGLSLLMAWLPLPTEHAVWMVAQALSVAVVVVPLAWASALTGTGRTLALLGGVVSVLGWVGTGMLSSLFTVFDRETAELLIRSASLASDAGLALAFLGVVVGTKIDAVRGSAAVAALLAVFAPAISWATNAKGTAWKFWATVALLGLLATAIATLVSAKAQAPLSPGTWDDGAKGAKRFGQVLVGFFVLGFAQNRLASTVGASAPELFDGVAALTAAGLMFGGMFALRQLAKAPDAATQVLGSAAGAAAGAGALIALAEMATGLVEDSNFGGMLSMMRAAAWGVALTLMLATSVGVAKARSQSGVAPLAIAGMVTYVIGLMALAQAGMFTSMMHDQDDTALVALAVGGVFSLIAIVLTLVVAQRTSKACETTAPPPAYGGQPTHPQPY